MLIIKTIGELIFNDNNKPTHATKENSSPSIQSRFESMISLNKPLNKDPIMPENLIIKNRIPMLIKLDCNVLK